MSKNRYIELSKKHNIIAIIICIVILLSIKIIISNNLIPKFSDHWLVTYILYVLALVFVLVSFGALISFTKFLILDIFYEHKAKKAYLTSFARVKRQLSTEFSEVILKDSDNLNLLDFIPAENIHCMAKLDKSNNIIYQVQVNMVASTDDYENFLKHFKV